MFTESFKVLILERMRNFEVLMVFRIALGYLSNPRVGLGLVTVGLGPNLKKKIGPK